MDDLRGSAVGQRQTSLESILASCRAILFDIGNTLVSAPFKMRWPGLLQETLNQVSNYLLNIGYQIPVEDRIHQRAEAENYENADYAVRPLAGRLAHIYCLQNNSPILQDLVSIFCEHLVAIGQIYSDTIPTLEELHQRGYRMAAVSNLPWGCPSEPWRRELARLGLTEYLEAVVYCSDVGWRKPAPQPFCAVLHKLGLDSGDCIFVGDDPRWDLAGPHSIGMPAVIIDRSTTLALPGVPIIHSLAELVSNPNQDDCKDAD